MDALSCSMLFSFRYVRTGRMIGNLKHFDELVEKFWSGRMPLLNRQTGEYPLDIYEGDAFFSVANDVLQYAMSVPCRSPLTGQLPTKDVDARMELLYACSVLLRFLKFHRQLPGLSVPPVDDFVKVILTLAEKIRPVVSGWVTKPHPRDILGDSQDILGDSQVKCIQQCLLNP